MKKALHIKDWIENFTVSQSRREINNPRWVPVPIRMDGARYRLLTAKSRGEEYFGIFMALVEVAAGCVMPGWLINKDHRPLTVEQIAAKTGMRGPKIAKAIEVLSSDEIGWLVEDEIPLHSEHARSTLGEHSEHARSTLRLDQTRPEEIREDKTRPEEPRLAEKAVGVATASPGPGPGKSPRIALLALNVRDPALAGLLAAGVTHEQIAETWAGIMRDSKIVNRQAVLVSRLSRLLGLDKPKPKSHIGDALGTERIRKLREQAKSREFAAPSTHEEFMEGAQ